MHRKIASAVLLFWVIVFGGLAYASLSGAFRARTNNLSEFDLLLQSIGGLQLMPVLLMVVAALFGWALLALIVSDDEAFREVEAYSYASAIFIMCACALLTLFDAKIALSIPAVLSAALVVCVAASKSLLLVEQPEAITDHGREIARQMALDAAHNSLLSRVSGRGAGGQIEISKKSERTNITQFPIKPLNGGNI